jgi:hypothetical protein
MWKGKDHPGDIGVDGKVVLKWILVKQYLCVCIGFISLRTRNDGGFL